MNSIIKHTHYDAIIIGARCAGAATAMLMARQGARVLIVDRDKKLHDTLSTHALMRPAVTLLDQWGLLRQISAAQTPAVRSTHFRYGAEHFEIPIDVVGNARGLYAPRRWLLDRVLRDAATCAGAELHSGVSLLNVLKSASGRVTGAALRPSDGTIKNISAGVVIGADGRRSAVAEQVNARVIARSDECSATVYTYVNGLENKGYRWYYGDKVAAGLIPTTSGMHCLFTSCEPQAYAGLFKENAFRGAMSILAQWEPGIATDLRERGACERMRRFPGAPGHLRDCAGAGWALVGDAGYFKDPATAHGITDAFLDANRLAKALMINPGEPREYQAARDTVAPALFDLTHRIASLKWDLDTLKGLHLELTDCLKIEQAELTSAPVSIAA